MARRVLSLAVAFSFVTTQLYALDFEKTVRKAVRESATQAQQVPTPKKNLYLWPGVALIAGGSALAIVGFTRTGEITISGTGASTRVTTGEKHNTALGVVGLGIAGAGAFALWAGDKKRSSPAVTFGPRSLRVEKTISW